MQANVLSQQRLDNGNHPRLLHQFKKERVHLVGRFDATHTRILRGMRRLQIVNVVMSLYAGSLCNQIRDGLANSAQGRRINYILDYQIAVFAVEGDVLLVDHCILQTNSISRILRLRRGVGKPLPRSSWTTLGAWGHAGRALRYFKLKCHKEYVSVPALSGGMGLSYMPKDNRLSNQKSN